LAGKPSKVYKEFRARLDIRNTGTARYSGKDELLDRLELELEKTLRRNHRAFNAYGKR